MVFIVVFLLLSGVSWYFLGHWYFVFTPVVLIYFIEYGCRAYKLGEYLPPLTRRIYKYLLKLKIPKGKSGILGKGEISTSKDHIPQQKLLSSIADWLVKDMAQCLFYKNYASIGIGTQEQIQEALGVLVAQYYEASKNENVATISKIKAQLLAIELQWEHVNTLALMLAELYLPAGAEVFKKMYPFHQYQCDFSKESFAEDWKRVCAGEVHNKILHTQLSEQLAGLEKDNESNAHLTPEQKHRGLINKLADIKKVEGVSLDNSTMTVLELAIYETRLQDHIKYLKEQTKKHAGTN